MAMVMQATGIKAACWENGTFVYDRAVDNLGSVGVAKVYDRSVNVDDNAVRASFNGGRKGTAAQPTGHQEALARA